MTANESLRALSIRQPWAGLILAGVKRVENRTWPTRYRGVLVIHAGGRRDHEAPMPVRRAAAILPTTRPTGFLGLAVLTDVHADAGCCRPWGESGAWHWVFIDPAAPSQAIPGPGRLGLFPVPATVATALRTELAATFETNRRTS